MMPRTFLLPVSRRALPLASAILRSSARLQAADGAPVRFRAVVDARAPANDRAALVSSLPSASVVDFSHADDLAAILDGCEGLVLASGVSVVDVLAEEPFVRAAAVTGSLQHVLKVSGPTGLVDQAAPTSLGRAHWQIERTLREELVLGREGGQCRVQVARAASSMQSLLEGRLHDMICGRMLSVSVKSGRVAFLHPDDLADAVMGLASGNSASTVEEDGDRWTVFSLTGPEALSFPQVCETLSKAVGERVRYSHFPLWAVQPALWIKGVSAEQITEEVALARAREAGLEHDVTETVSELTGRPMRSLLEFAKQHKDDWPRAEFH